MDNQDNQNQSNEAQVDQTDSPIGHFGFDVAELTVLSLKPGDVLAVTITSDEVDHSAMGALQMQMQKVFPNNKVMILCVPSGDNINFTKIEPNDQKAVDCNSPVGYCNDCTCGKKEQAQGE